MTSTKTVLIEAKALIEDPKNWTQGESARDETGEECSIARGVCFCAIGAVEKILDQKKEDNLFWEIVADLDKSTPVGSAVDTNDLYGHDAVMTMFDKAIANAN